MAYLPDSLVPNHSGDYPFSEDRFQAHCSDVHQLLIYTVFMDACATLVFMYAILAISYICSIDQIARILQSKV
jgi:hypothetical protein